MNRKERRRQKTTGARDAQSYRQRLSQAFDFQKTGKFRKAERIYKELLKENPRDPDALHLSGMLAFQTGDSAGAVRAIGKSLGQRPDNADAHNNLGLALQAEGQFEAAESHFREALQLRPSFADALNNLGNSLLEQDRLDDAKDCFLQAIEQHPHFPEANVNLAIVYEREGRLVDSAETYRRIVSELPDFFDAWLNLGNTLLQLKDFDAAVHALMTAVGIRPNSAEAHANLGIAYKEVADWRLAERHIKSALALEPNFAMALYNLGNVYYEQGMLEKALESYEESLAIEPDSAVVRRSLGDAQLLSGDFSSGWANYAWRLKMDTALSAANQPDCPEWEGQALAGKRLFLLAEQGVGDQILYASMIPDLVRQGADVVLACERRLVPLFARSFPAIQAIGVEQSGSVSGFDFRSNLGNLGKWLRTTEAAFPSVGGYLTADPGQRKRLRDAYLERGNAVLVGIAWHSSSPAYGRKSMKLDELRPVVQMPGVTFVDFQYGDTTAERSAFSAETGLELLHDKEVDQLKDMDLFAAQVAAMDFVVTISNTTAHMAGALGVPTLLMLDPVPIWYWMADRSDSPWYPSLRLFRQSSGGGWGGVVDQVRGVLIAETNP